MQHPGFRPATALVAIAAAVVTILLGPATALAEGFRATIHFADGRSVPVEYFGYGDQVYDYEIDGYLGDQRVTYNFSAIAEVIFTDHETKSYRRKDASSRGTLIVVSRAGKRFTIERAAVTQNSPLMYFYLDPVTESRQHASSEIRDRITHIEIGEDTGGLKKNPTTGEFFPARFSFDPFTGERLIWANRTE